MMKKNGFTLAEVLITLAIIGVVATLTLPSLMTNTAEQQAVTGFRKAMNTLNEVAQMNAAVDGFDYSGIDNSTGPATGDVYDTNGVLIQSIWAMMASKSQVNVAQSVSAGIGGGCSGKSQIFFRDGTVLCYESVKTNGDATKVINGFVDTNGKKAPNAISECGSSACKKNERAIKDQFAITLYGSIAIPGQATVGNTGSITEAADNKTYAAQWAMSK